MACTCTFDHHQHMRPPYRIIIPRSQRLFVPAHTDSDFTFKQSIEEAKQSWRLGCFDNKEVMNLEPSRAPFPFLYKKAINELAHLLRHPDPNTIPSLQHFAITSSTHGSPINCLPPEVITMILSYLCDFDALSLALSSRHMFNMCGFRLQKMLDHRTSGGWIGKRLAAVGDKAYTPGFINYEPKIQGCNTGMVVPSRSSRVNDILDILFSRFKIRESATAKRIIEPDEDEDLGSQPEIRYERRKRLVGIVASGRYPESINKILRFLLVGSTKVSGATAPGGKKSYVIRNLARRHYIHAFKGESFKIYLRKVASHKKSLEGTDCGHFTAEEAVICAFAMEIMWGGSRKEGEWAAGSFDIIDEGMWDMAKAEQEGWEDVSNDVVKGAISAIQGVY